MRTSSISQWHKLNVIHCSVDDSYLKATPTPLQDNNTLVCVGRLCEQKGQLLLIQAEAQLVHEGLNVQLRLVGDGEMRLDCESEIRRCGLEDHVIITGWASGEQVRNEILEARAFVLTSFAEGLPVVLMESLAMERPALSTYIAGIPELVLPGENGWLILPGDKEALVNVFKEIKNNPVILGNYGLCSYEIAQDYSPENVNEKLGRIYEELLALKPISDDLDYNKENKHAETEAY